MKILLISGHGAGDPGATSIINGTSYREADETRRVTAALQKSLGGYCDVTIYPTSRNAYSDYKKGVLNSTAGFSKYDYVLEIHFNALKLAASDNKTKGVECYVTKTESGTTVEDRICKEISAVGLTNRGVKRYNWSVINTARNAGVSSALLEICFIDDPDDMRIYTQKFQQIIDGITTAIVDGFGLKKTEEKDDDDMVIYKTLSDVPSWGQATVKKLMAKGYLEGTGEGLNLEHNMLRVLVINDRAGLYG